MYITQNSAGLAIGSTNPADFRISKSAVDQHSQKMVHCENTRA